MARLDYAGDGRVREPVRRGWSSFRPPNENADEELQAAIGSQASASVQAHMCACMKSPTMRPRDGVVDSELVGS